MYQWQLNEQENAVGGHGYVYERTPWCCRGRCPVVAVVLTSEFQGLVEQMKGNRRRRPVYFIDNEHVRQL